VKNCMIWARKNDFARWNRESYGLISLFRQIMVEHGK